MFDLTNIIAQVYERKYPDLLGRSLVSVSPDHTDATATRWNAKVIDRTGTAQIWKDRSREPARVGVHEVGDITGLYHSIADSYFYSDREVEAAAANGRDLPTLLAFAARDAIERRLEAVIMSGDGLPEIKGVFNQTGILTASASANWSSMTGEQLVAEFIALDNYQSNATLGILSPNTCAVSPAVWQLLMAPYSVYDSRATLEVVQQRMSNLKNFVKVPYLSDKTYVQTYNSSPEMMALLLPQDFTQYEPKAEGRGLSIACEIITGGIVCPHPKSILQYSVSGLV